MKFALGGSSDSGSDSKSSGRIMNGRKLKLHRGYVAIGRLHAGYDKASGTDWNVLRLLGGHSFGTGSRQEQEPSRGLLRLPGSEQTFSRVVGSL